MTLLDQCCGLHGELSDDNRRLIIKMLEGGSEGVWKKAKNIIISPVPIITLEQAVNRILPGGINFIKKGGIPDPFTIRRALIYSIRKRKLFRMHPEPFDIET
ncbi:MAG: hypothetical protein OEZ34_16250 [Spirochaetia bacterium]|nr:hypothetical protein [Spirochaetia bacterium]